MALPLGAENLPYDVLVTIFSYLPIPDLGRCAATCPQWKEVVRGFPLLWRGKRFLTHKSPLQCPKTHDILRAIPALEEIFIEEADEFAVDLAWPCLILLVVDIWNVGRLFGNMYMQTWNLTTSLDILQSLLSVSSAIDFENLKSLQIVRAVPTLEQQHTLERERQAFRRQQRTEGEQELPPSYVDTFHNAGPVCNPEEVLATVLRMSTGLEELSVYAEFLSGDSLAEIGIGRLRVIQIECPGLDNLKFLEPCAANLKELELKGCADLASTAYRDIRHLRNLQRLSLRDCYVTSEDVEVAAEGFGSLDFLLVDCCDLVSNLSFLRRCYVLRELRVKVSPLDSPLTGLQYLPSSVRILWLTSNTVVADELSAALPRLPDLEELNLGSSQLDHLKFLEYCPQLRRLCLEFCYWYDPRALKDLVHLKRLEALDLTRCAIDADILFCAMQPMQNLETLTMSHAENVSHLRFLRHCQNLRHLSLFYVMGLETQEYCELRHLTKLEQVCVTTTVYEFVRQLLLSYLPDVSINCIQ